MRATSTASVVLSPKVRTTSLSGVYIRLTLLIKSKLAVLSSLSNFLREAMIARDGTSSQPRTSSSATPTWFLASSFTSKSAFKAFRSLITPRTASAGDPSPSHTKQCPEDTSPALGGGFAGSFDFTRSLIADGWTLEHLSEVDIDQLSVQSGSSSNNEARVGDSFASVRRQRFL